MWSSLGEHTTLRAYYVKLSTAALFTLSNYKEKGGKKLGCHEEKMEDHADSKINLRLQVI